MIESARLLGFAFAGADLLFEIDTAGLILFAAGATTRFADRSDLVGQPVRNLFLSCEQGRLNDFVKGIKPGDRLGPLPLMLASGEKAVLCLCYLPQNERISCTLVKIETWPEQPLPAEDAETGLPDGDAFLSVATKNIGTMGAVALVNVPELSMACASLAPKESASLLAGIGTAVKGMGATIAARLSKTGFGVVTENPHEAKSLAARIEGAMREHGHAALKFEEILLSLKGRNLTPEQTALALRHVVSRFAEGKLKRVPDSDLAKLFEQMVDETLARAHAFNGAVANRAFELVFEPIVNLKTGSVSHYEALTRFEAGKSPADLIRFAEDLGLAEALDLAVTVSAFELFEREPGVTDSVAINISGRSIANSSAFALFSGLLKRNQKFAKRILIEITESSEIPDLTKAARAVEAIRSLGFRLGIDDFGAGTAWLKYLHGFSVDFVKVDGKLIERLGKSEREDAILKTVLESCAAMKIETIAEWIDSPGKLKACLDFGFAFGQGRQFGEPLHKLPGQDREILRVRRFPGTAHGRSASSSGQR